GVGCLDLGLEASVLVGEEIVLEVLIEEDEGTENRISIRFDEPPLHLARLGYLVTSRSSGSSRAPSASRYVMRQWLFSYFAKVTIGSAASETGNSPRRKEGSRGQIPHRTQVRAPSCGRCEGRR